MANSKQIKLEHAWCPLLVASLLAQKMEGTLPWFQPKDRHLVSSQRVTSLAFPVLTGWHWAELALATRACRGMTVANLAMRQRHIDAKRRGWMLWAMLGFEVEVAHGTTEAMDSFLQCFAWCLWVLFRRWQSNIMQHHSLASCDII